MVGGIDLDFGGNTLGVERSLHLVLHGGVLLVVVLRDGDQHGLGLHLRHQQVRAGRRGGGETAAMEAAAGLRAVRNERQRAHDQRSAHAVSGRADALGGVDLLLLVEPADRGNGILLRILRITDGRPHQRDEALANRRVREFLGRRVKHLALGQSVERVHRQDSIAGFRKALAHQAEGRAQTHDIRPDKNGRMLAR